MRISIPTVKNIVGQNRCAIYDENENLMDAKSVSAEQKVICILEIQGIKFSSKYFQVDIHARQMMVFNEVSLFKSCMIRQPSARLTNKHTKEKNPSVEIEDTKTLQEICKSVNYPHENRQQMINKLNKESLKTGNAGGRMGCAVIGLTK